MQHTIPLWDDTDADRPMPYIEGLGCPTHNGRPARIRLDDSRGDCDWLAVTLADVRAAARKARERAAQDLAARVPEPESGPESKPECAPQPAVKVLNTRKARAKLNKPRMNEWDRAKAKAHAVFLEAVMAFRLTTSSPAADWRASHLLRGCPPAYCELGEIPQNAEYLMLEVVAGDEVVSAWECEWHDGRLYTRHVPRPVKQI